MYTKKALRRREGFPVDQPAPLFLECVCGTEVDIAPGVELHRCRNCGRAFSSGGWLQSDELPAFRVHLSDGSSYVTSMAQGVTLEQAQAYFVGQWFEQADERTMLQAVAVEVEAPPWYRQIHGTSWVAYRGRQAIWEASTEADLLAWLREHGIHAEHWPLRILRVV